MNDRFTVLILLVLLAVIGTPLLAADQARQVEVICDQPQWCAGKKLRVLAYQQAIKGFRPLADMEATFDQQGRWQSQLSDNTYIFELLSEAPPDTIIALRTSRITVASDTRLRLQALDPTPMTFLADKKPVDIEMLTVRSAATESALVWHVQDAPPRAVLSPGQMYWVGLFGRRENDCFAYWSTLRPEDRGHVNFSPRPVFTANFHWRDLSPTIDSTQPARIDLFFPDADWPLDVNTDVLPRLVTNRRYVELAYSYPSTTGKRIRLSRQGYLIRDKTDIEVGGPLTPRAWIALQRQRIDTGYSDYLCYGAWLDDPSGHILDVQASQIDSTSKLLRADGSDIPSNPLSAEAKAAIGALPADFRVEMNYQIDQPEQVTLTPGTPAAQRSRHFIIQAMPGWDWRNRCYLDKLERAYDCLQPISAYPGSNTVNIGWIINDHRARGGWNGHRTGSKNGHINMPFRTIRDQSSYFDHPAFLTHETAHTFGYAHGEQMDRTVNEAFHRFVEIRWYAADHPEYVPNLLRH